MDNNGMVVDGNGKVNMNGLNINIADIVGEKIVNQWMASLSQEDMQLFFNAINELAFTTGKKFIDDEYKEIKLVRKTQENKDYSWRKEEDTPLWKYAQSEFQARFRGVISEEIERILNTDEYKAKATAIANEIIEYAINGYKEDMCGRIRERLVGNVTEATPYYGGYSLLGIINQEIDRRFS